MDNARTAWLLSAVRTLALILALILAPAPAFADGDPLPVARTRAAQALDRVRQDPRLASDPAAIDDLVRRAEAFPPGPTRTETWLFAANAYAERLDRPAAAIPLWRKVVVEPDADPVLVAIATRALVNDRLAHDDVDGAEEALALAGTRADPAARRIVVRAKRRRRAHQAALGALAATLLLAGAALARAIRRREARRIAAHVRASGRLVLVVAGYVALGGAALATIYEPGTGRPFVVFGALLVPLLLLARAWGAAGSPSRRARVARAALCATSAIAVAFLVLERLDVAYLEGLGL